MFFKVSTFTLPTDFTPLPYFWLFRSHTSLCAVFVCFCVRGHTHIGTAERCSAKNLSFLSSLAISAVVVSVAAGAAVGACGEVAIRLARLTISWMAQADRLKLSDRFCLQQPSLTSMLDSLERVNTDRYTELDEFNNISVSDPPSPDRFVCR